MSDHDFQVEVLTGLAELRTDMKAVKEHLGRLNGKVAAHEERIGAVQLEQARQEGKAVASSRWVETLKPAIWTLLGVLCALAVQHGYGVLKIIAG